MPNEPAHVEIITGRERRRRYTANEKLSLVEATLQPGMTVSAVARLHGVSPSLLFKWRQLMSQGGQVAVKADEDVIAASKARELEQRVRELERLLGRKTMEVEILKEALANLRIPADHRAVEPGAPRIRCRTGQPQTRLPPDGQRAIAATTACRPSSCPGA